MKYKNIWHALKNLYYNKKFCKTKIYIMHKYKIIYTGWDI